MNRKTKRLTILWCILLLMLAFSTGVSATDSFYAEEEAGSDTEFFTVTPLTDGVSPSAMNGNLVIVLDPGHGPADSGAVSVANTYERDLNLAVAKYCKTYLERYNNVSVFLTHYDNSGSKKLELAERAATAANHGADLLISIHFNSADTNTYRGAEAYVSLLEEYEITALANSIVDQLGNLGLKEIGVKTLKSKTGDLWTDGIRIADYYGIIRGSCKQEIPSMIVEHCFINNSNDYYGFASTEAQLKALGEADAKAIVSYFGLDKTTSATTLENARYTALQKLNEQYQSMVPGQYDTYHRSKMVSVYQDAKERIEIANNVGKIDLTVNRAVKTLKNYPITYQSDTQFIDCFRSDWFWPAVDYCVNEGLFVGTSANTFAPRKEISRGEFITALGRMEGVKNTIPSQTKFADVDPNAFYAPFVRWASETGVVVGTSETTYAPLDMIHREDLALMLYNYCNVKGIELPKVNNKTYHDFPDGNEVDTWAKEAMSWIVATGIMQGNDKGELNPRDNTTRAEVAQLMMKFDTTLKSLES